jgi:predicted Zn-dependent peptidase
LDEVKAWRKGLLEDGRMIIVAVGDFALEALLPRLESSFGTLPRAGRKVARIPRWKGSPMLIADGPEGPAQDAWIIGLLPAPSYGDAGSPPFRLADRILNALFRARIRSDERDSQAAGSFYFDGWGAHFAMIVVDTADPLKAKAWIDQSIQALAEGLSPGLPESPEALAPLTETLASWKAAALSRFYARAGSSQAIAAGLGEAFLYTGRPAEYFLMDERSGGWTPFPWRRRPRPGSSR